LLNYQYNTIQYNVSDNTALLYLFIRSGITTSSPGQKHTAFTFYDSTVKSTKLSASNQTKKWSLSSSQQF